MIVIGLTGSIGMGKSAVAAMFTHAGVPVFDADAAVHRLYGPGGAAVAPVAERFAGVVRDGVIDRAALSAAVMGDPATLADLEAIVHPLVRAEQDAFLAAARAAGADLAVLEIPLLYETGAEARVDTVVVVSAPADIQRARVLARPGMSEAKLDAILARQTPDREKRRRADFVVDTSTSLEQTAGEVAAIVAALANSARGASGGTDARDRA